MLRAAGDDEPDDGQANGAGPGNEDGHTGLGRVQIEGELLQVGGAVFVVVGIT